MDLLEGGWFGPVGQDLCGGRRGHGCLAASWCTHAHLQMLFSHVCRFCLLFVVTSWISYLFACFSPPVSSVILYQINSITKRWVEWKKEDASAQLLITGQVWSWIPKVISLILWVWVSLIYFSQSFCLQLRLPDQDELPRSGRLLVSSIKKKQKQKIDRYRSTLTGLKDKKLNPLLLIKYWDGH